MAGKNIQQEKELRLKICFLFSPQEALAALMSGIEWLCSGVKQTQTISILFNLNTVLV